MLRILLIMLLLLSACARTPKTDLDAADALWQRYANLQPDKPYKADLSLRLGKSGDTRRVTALLWGNDNKTIRLDVLAGVGTTIAKIYSDPNHFLIVDTLQHKAYAHEGRSKPQLRLGVPLPLRLQDMADLINGRFVNVFGQEHAEVKAGSKGICYHIPGRFAGELELDAQARPISWQEKGQGWDLTCEFENSSLPTRLTLKNHKGEFALVLVREHAWVEPYAKSKLSLAVPTGTDVLPLAKYAAKAP